MSQFYQGTTAGSLPPTVPTSFVTDSGTAVPAANIININGGTGVLISANPNLSNNILVTVQNDGFTWSEQNTNFNAAIQNGYYCNGALTASLPATTTPLIIGNTIIIYVDTSSTVMIQANTGQFIQVGSTISSSGGTASSNTRGATLELNFKPSDNTWHTISSLGSWTTA